jgi:hydroxymethylbilane synthase
VPIRGNADTRLAKVRDGGLDAVVLAYAGLARIGRTDVVSEVFEPDDMVPAPGQGALAVECRADDSELIALLSAIDDAATRAAVTAERSLLAALEAGCSAPVGAYAVHGPVGDRLTLDGIVLGGTIAVRERGEADAADAVRLGHELAARMLALGAADLVSATIDREDAHD